MTFPEVLVVLERILGMAGVVVEFEAAVEAGDLLSFRIEDLDDRLVP